ncbi:hypothetical protein PXD04_09085 [Methanosphaera sp. ISO3-F5]|uniref:hypothetical protein n=1 Tax=Methanosphaera sp. ISO3-F5 TaxID=1452353 RepID=UPI002B257894|nr:hypothetical protein [Methanosphaera sp. ISO3-F5]WQH63842.1 hypothetical protein PXD04_09085 [Methanosphaera sp. ISO3-F5]
MSLLDKINDSIPELDNKDSSNHTNSQNLDKIEEKYTNAIQENKKLKEQLKKSKCH